MSDPNIPSGVYFVNCIEYRDRVADLARHDPRGPIIGYHNKNGSNQKWTFHPHHDNRFRKWKISTTASKGVVSYAYTNRTQGEVVFCKPEESEATIYSVESFPGGYRIYTGGGPGGASLFWTLDGEAEETKVKLQTAGWGNKQVWSLTKTQA